MQYEEHRLQKAICTLLDQVLYPSHRYFAIPNGARTDMRSAGRLKAEGMKAGVPDISLVGPGFFGFIEVKREKNSYLSGSQKDWRDWCLAQGIPWCLARSIEDVLEALTDWNIPYRRTLV